MAKAQTMVLVDEQVRDRADALRLVTGTSRADVMRGLIEHALPQYEQGAANRLARLEAVAERADMASVGGFVRTLVAGRQVIPSLETLEAMNATQLRAELKKGKLK